MRGVLGTEYGDSNNDKRVDLIDLNALAASYGNAGVWASGDFNGDKRVDLIDLDRLGLHYGFNGSGGVSVPSAPEPGTGALLAAGAWRLRRRGRERPG